MPDFLLELLSEEIPARMQERARADLARLFEAEIGKAGLNAQAIKTFSTPRRLALIARGLPPETAPVRDELKGPRTSAPPQALEGFLRKTGLTQAKLTERDGVYYAVIDKPGRATSAVLAEAIPAIVRAFPWPKSMRWGEASRSTESLRWVRPLHGVVALLGQDIVPFEIDGIVSGAETAGHRFHHPGRITIGSADDYAAKLRACHVIVDHAERESIIAEGATTLAAQAGLTLVRDEALLRENAGLTEWPVPLLGGFDPAFLEVPPEVIQLTMAVNQKYFAALKSSPAFAGEGDHAKHGGGARSEAEGLTSPDGLSPSTTGSAGGPPPQAKLGEDLELAPAFICTANIEAHDGGAAIVAGNRKVLAARLSDAKFFWEQDLKVPLEEQAKKLDQIVFHEKLGTVADKVERVTKLARWLVEENIVTPAKAGAQESPVEGLGPGLRRDDDEKEKLAEMAEQAARLCKADLVTGMVGEFPELQGVMGGYYARAQGYPPQVADAIRHHYKPVGQGDEVPTAPVTVAVSLADKLDTISGFFAINERPTGSKDPFALRRAALGVLSLLIEAGYRMPVAQTVLEAAHRLPIEPIELQALLEDEQDFIRSFGPELASNAQAVGGLMLSRWIAEFIAGRLQASLLAEGKRPDFVRAAFFTGMNDFLSLIALANALQSFVETVEGRDLLAGYKRAANILKKEGWATPNPLLSGEGRLAAGERGEDDQAPSPSPSQPAAGPLPLPAGEGNSLSYTPEPAESSLVAALDSAEPRARAAVAAEDFEGAMQALATLRAPVDAFFDQVTVNDPAPAKRAARLDLLARVRDAVHQVADFSRIEG